MACSLKTWEIRHHHASWSTVISLKKTMLDRLIAIPDQEIFKQDWVIAYLCPSKWIVQIHSMPSTIIVLQSWRDALFSPDEF
jgi:hypothetical protein